MKSPVSVADRGTARTKRLREGRREATLDAP
jgi:hypothetical protein